MRGVHFVRLSAVCLALAGNIACMGKGSGESAAGGGQQAPALQGKTMTGDYIQLSDFKGTVVLVNIWATWCEPCKMELPELGRLHRELSPKGFTMLGVTVDKQAARRKVEHFIDKHDLAYPMIFDPDGHSVGAFDVKGYPTSLLVGRDGTLRWRRDGIIKNNDGELGKQIEAALADPQPAAEPGS